MRKPQAITSLVAALALVGLVAGCGADATATPERTPTPLPTATSTPLPPGATPLPTPTSAPPPATDTFAVEWAELIAAAQAEGEVFLALGGSATRYGRAAFAAFEQQTGVRVIAGSGSGTDNVNRILAERARGLFTVDVVTFSGGSLDRLRAAGYLLPVAEWLIHPTVIDRSTGWYLTETVWAEVDKKYVMADSLTVGNIGAIWYNTNNVTQADLDLIDDYPDLLRPEFKGRLAVRAMNLQGGKSVINRIWLTPGLGPEFLEALHRDAEVNLVIPSGDDELSNGVATGKWDFGLFGASSAFRTLQTLQLPVRELTLTKQVGGLSTEIGGGVGMLGNSRHPNAAKLFANWWYTKEGQTAKIEARSAFGPQDSVSLRSDVTRGSLLDHLWVVIQRIPQWTAEGTLSDHLIVFEENKEWFELREQTEKFFNDLYIELGYDAFVTYN